MPPAPAHPKTALEPQAALAAPGRRGKAHRRSPKVMPGPTAAAWRQRLPLSVPSRGFAHPLPVGVELAGAATCRLGRRWWRAQRSNGRVASVSSRGSAHRWGRLQVLAAPRKCQHTKGEVGFVKWVCAVGQRRKQEKDKLW